MAEEHVSISGKWMRMIVDRNPCYLLSGAFMLVGCSLLNVAMATKAGDLRRLLVLLGTINVYELLLVALGVMLIRRPAFVRDGRVLLALEALFLVDVTFISGLVATVSAGWGVAMNSALLLLAAGKMWVVLRALGVPWAGRMGVFVFIQILVLLAVPVVFKFVAMGRHGKVPEMAAYGMWWVGGVMPVVGVMVARRRRLAIGRGNSESGLAWVYVGLGFVSMIAHLWSAGWVYSIPFSGVFVAPILLGAAGALAWEGRRVLPHPYLLRVEAALLAMAIYLSGGEGMTHAMGGFIISPLRAVLIVVAGIGLFLAWRYWRFPLAWPIGVLGMASVIGAMLGHTYAAMWENGRGLAERNVPRTMMEWGVAAVGMAFALLGMGAVGSLRKQEKLTSRQGPQSGDGRSGPALE